MQDAAMASFAPQAFPENKIPQAFWLTPHGNGADLRFYLRG